MTSGSSYFNAFLAAKEAVTKSKIDTVLGHKNYVRDRSYVNNAIIATTNNEEYTSGQRLFAVNLLEHLELQPQYLDTSLVGTVEIQIQFADNAVCSSVAGVLLPGARTAAATIAAGGFDKIGTGATYTVSALRLSVPVIGFASSFYDEMIQSRVASQGFVEYSFKNIFASEHSHLNSTRVSVSTQSLDRVWTAFRHPDYHVQGAPVSVVGSKRSVTNIFATMTDAQVTAGLALGNDPGFSTLNEPFEKYVSKYFRFQEPTLTGANVTAKLRLAINGVNMPQSEVSSSEAYGITKNNILGSSYICEDKMTLAQYRTNFYVQCLARMNISDGEMERGISGCDTRNSSADITLTTSGIATANLLVFLECTSSMRVNGQRSLEIVV